MTATSGDVPVGSGVLARFDAGQLGRLRAHAASMRETLTQLERLARTDLSIALIGETGTGKSVVAQAIHEASPRRLEGFVMLDCASLPAVLDESEPIDRDGASESFRQCIRAIDRARGGTLFINDVDEASLEWQTRLVRVLDSRRPGCRGSGLKRASDVRVIASAQRDLASETAAGRFRKELFFRVSAATVRVPPLRERTEDLSLLVPQLLVELGRDKAQVSAEGYAWLRRCSWPGNVRELKDLLAGIEGDQIDVDALRSFPAGGESDWLDRLPLAGFTLARLEETAIRQTLIQTGGNKMLAARTLGIAVSTLYEKLKRY